MIAYRKQILTALPHQTLLQLVSRLDAHVPDKRSKQKLIVGLSNLKGISVGQLLDSLPLATLKELCQLLGIAVAGRKKQAILTALEAQEPISKTAASKTKGAAQKSQSQVATKANTKPTAKAATKANAKPTAKAATKANAKPTAKATTKANAKPLAKAAAKANAKPTAKATTKANAKPPAKAATKANAKPTTKASAKPTAKAAAKANAKPPAKTATKAKTRSRAKAATKANTKPPATAATEAKTKPAAQAATKINTKPTAKVASTTQQSTTPQATAGKPVPKTVSGQQVVHTARQQALLAAEPATEQTVSNLAADKSKGTLLIVRKPAEQTTAQPAKANITASPTHLNETGGIPAAAPSRKPTAREKVAAAWGSTSTTPLVTPLPRPAGLMPLQGWQDDNRPCNHCQQLLRLRKCQIQSCEHMLLADASPRICAECQFERNIVSITEFNERLREERACPHCGEHWRQATEANATSMA